MPIHDVGYRSWDGEKTPTASRWWIICETGVRLAAKSSWVRRILFVAWLPVLYWGIGFFFVEKAIDADFSQHTQTTAGLELPDNIPELEGLPSDQDLARMTIERSLRGQFNMFPHAEALADSFRSNDTSRIRNDVWRWLLMVFFRYPQAILILFLVGSVAPSLIAHDVRSRAFLLYFSRPIGKLEYMLGKLAVPSLFIIAVTMMPALALYFFAILMSPTLSVIASTWDIPLRILVATAALVIPTASISLMFSSLTQESRFANFSWFALWSLGHGAYLAVVVATAMQMNQPPVSPEVLESAAVKNWSVLSLYNNLGDIQAMIFGFADFGDAWRGILALGLATAISLVVLYRRISAPMNI